MINRHLIPYNLAVKLKGLGFNDSCIAYWRTPSKLEYYFNHNSAKGMINDISAPLYEQAFDWFERFNMYSVIERTSIGSDEWEYSYSINYLPIEFKDYKRRGIHFKWIHSFREDGTCYEGAWGDKNEAREECLKRLIQIIENEK